MTTDFEHDSALIIDLLPATLSDPSNAQAAAEAIQKFIFSNPQTFLPRLELTLRERSPYLSESIYLWHRLKPSQLDLLERFGSASTSLLGIASFHANGYVREEAIRRLSRLNSGGEVPFLILRLNDWVANVRDAAVEAIYSRLKPEHCRAFIASFLLLSRLRHAGRTDPTEILAAINQLLLSEECRGELMEALKSDDRFIRRAAFKLALKLQGADLKHAVGLALDDNETAIRGWAAQAITSAVDGDMFDSFLDRLKHDRFMPLRRAALRILVKLHSPHVVDELNKALLDPHASMREEARYHLKKIGPIDIAEFYRQRLSDAKGPALYGVISGLGEMGKAEDVSVVVPYTSHEASKIRRAALKTVAALRLDAHLEIFLKALEDEMPRVSLQAMKALAARTSLLDAGRVSEVFRSSTRGHVRRNALLLITKFSKWESISYLVNALCETDADMVAMSRLRISDWLGGFNNSSSYPTPEQVKKLKDALERCGELVDEETRQQLEFALRSSER